MMESGCRSTATGDDGSAKGPDEHTGQRALAAVAVASGTVRSVETPWLYDTRLNCGDLACRGPLRKTAIMLVTWREEKNRKNKKDHGISFETAQFVFEDPRFWMSPNWIVEGEERWGTMGWVRDQLLIVFHTYDEESGQEHAHLISARKPTKEERKLCTRQQSKAVFY